MAKKSREIPVSCSPDQAFEYAQTALYLTDRVVGSKDPAQHTILAGKKANALEHIERLSTAKLSKYERITINVQSAPADEAQALVAVTYEIPQALFDLMGRGNKYLNRFEAELQAQVAQHGASGAPTGAN